MVHITLVHCTSLLACLVLVSGAPSTNSYGKDPRYPGRPLPFPLKVRYDLLNPSETPSGDKIIQGDIVVDPSRPVPIKFNPDPESRWPEDPETGWPLMPYVITEESKNDIAKINEGLNQWMENTCITFKETTNTDQPHARFIKGGGCYASNGRTYWRNGQDISIGYGCENMHTVTHEVGHTIGFAHEQSRIDRDDSIKILWENIQDGNDVNFAKIETNSTGIEYDYTSVMQYDSNAFSRNGKPTMMSLNPYYQPLMSTYAGLTFRDMLLANRVYGCIEKWETACEMSGWMCSNEGYIGANCKCVCPSGTSGEDCGQVDGPYYPPLPCGGNITEATVISSLNYPDGQAIHEWCMWWIQAKENQKVRITFNDFDLAPRYNDGECKTIWDHLEMRNVSPLEPGDVFCGHEIIPGQKFVSQGQELFIASTSHAIRFRGFSATIDFI